MSATTVPRDRMWITCSCGSAGPGRRLPVRSRGGVLGPPARPAAVAVSGLSGANVTGGGGSTTCWRGAFASLPSSALSTVPGPAHAANRTEAAAAQSRACGTCGASGSSEQKLGLEKLSGSRLDCCADCRLLTSTGCKTLGNHMFRAQCLANSHCWFFSQVAMHDPYLLRADS